MTEDQKKLYDLCAGWRSRGYDQEAPTYFVADRDGDVLVLSAGAAYPKGAAVAIPEVDKVFAAVLAGLTADQGLRLSKQDLNYVIELDEHRWTDVDLRCCALKCLATLDGV